MPDTEPRPTHVHIVPDSESPDHVLDVACDCIPTVAPGYPGILIHHKKNITGQ